MPRPPTTLRAALLAGFLCYHLAAITLRALPAPDAAMDRAAWADPTVQRELEAWSRRLSGIGLALPREVLADRLYRIASRYIAIRDTALRPFAAYLDNCGTFQSWQMFVAPHRHPARIRLEIHEGGVWRTAFREGDPQAIWLARELGDTRFRSVLFRIGWPSYRGMREAFADWAARRAARDFPSADRLRLVLSRAESPTPAQSRRGELPPSVDDAPLERVLERFR